MSSRRVPYRKFSQSVRKFDCDRVLHKVALVSAELQRAEANLGPQRWPAGGPVRQFSLASVARTAIVDSGTRRKRVASGPVTDGELRDLCGLSIETDHADVPERGILTDPAMARMLARLMYHQALFAYSDYENMARSFGLLVDHDPSIRGVPTPSDWERVLGVPLPVYMAVVFQLASIATTYGGRVKVPHIEECHRLGCFAGADVATVLQLIRTHLAADIRSLRAEGQKYQIADAKMWSFNPLMGRPLIEYRGSGFVLPVYNYLIQKMTPLGFYFTGLSHFGSDFPRAMGDSFERYVGRHLAQLADAGAVVIPEITFGRENKRTIDYFLVFEELVVLVEVKGLRATADARAGVDEGLENLVRKVQDARDQIDKTAALIGTIPELSHIPSDRPLRGLVVTIEPVHQIDTYVYADKFGTNVVESSTSCAHDLERICPTLAKQSDAGRRVLDALTFNDPTPPSLDRAVKDLPVERNPVIDALWDSWIDVAPFPKGRTTTSATGPMVH